MGAIVQSVQSRHSHQIAAVLTSQVDSGAGAAQLANAVAAAWHGIEAAHGPIIGLRGMAALYKRSLHLSTAQHPWLGALNDGAQAPMDLPALTALLARQSATDAAAGGGALLQTFDTLLVNLVGASLTHRLLAPVWTSSFATSSAIAPLQHTSP